jgi:hypothetical protein
MSVPGKMHRVTTREHGWDSRPKTVFSRVYEVSTDGSENRAAAHRVIERARERHAAIPA